MLAEFLLYGVFSCGCFVIGVSTVQFMLSMVLLEVDVYEMTQRVLLTGASHSSDAHQVASSEGDKQGKMNELVDKNHLICIDFSERLEVWSAVLTPLLFHRLTEQQFIMFFCLSVIIGPAVCILVYKTESNKKS